MAILKPLSQAEIRAHFSHRGWFMACPVYVGGLSGKGMHLQERNGIPEWWLAVNGWAQGAIITLISLVDPFYEPAWGVYVTTPIAQEA